MDKMKDLILLSLAKKGKSKDMPEKAMDKGESKETETSDYDEHLEMIAKELIDAVHSKDVSAVADLLKEAFDCIGESKSDM